MKLDAIGIVTKDLHASFAFYRRLGLNPPAQPEGTQPESPHAEATLPNGLRFMWDTVELMQQLRPGYTHHPSHTVGAFLFENPAAVNAKYAELLEAGHVGITAPWDAFWGQRYAVVADPDGHHVDLFAPLE